MLCAEKEQFGLFGSVFFLGLVIGSLTLPKLSDVKGRKPIALFGNVLHVIAAMIILFSTSQKLTLWMLFFVGFATAGRVFTGFAWMSE